MWVTRKLDAVDAVVLVVLFITSINTWHDTAEYLLPKCVFVVLVFIVEIIFFVVYMINDAILLTFKKPEAYNQPWPLEKEFDEIYHHLFVHDTNRRMHKFGTFYNIWKVHDIYELMDEFLKFLPEPMMLCVCGWVVYMVVTYCRGYWYWPRKRDVIFHVLALSPYVFLILFAIFSYRKNMFGATIRLMQRLREDLSVNDWLVLTLFGENVTFFEALFGK